MIRQLAKFLPKTPRFERAIESHDADWDFQAAPTVIDVPTQITTIETNPAPEPQIAAAPAAQVVVQAPTPAPTKSNRITAQLAARAAALQGLKVPPPAPASAPAPRRAAPPPATGGDPVTAEQLAAYAKLHEPTITFFASYGRSRKFPVPMTSWSKDHVARAWEAYVYERDVLQTFGPPNGKPTSALKC